MFGIDWKQYKWFDSIWVRKTACETEHEVFKTYSSFMSYLLNDKGSPSDTKLKMMFEIDREFNEIIGKLDLLATNERRELSGLPALEKLFDSHL